MGLYDRDYTQADFKSQFRYAPQMHMALPRLTPVVRWLLIVNSAVYVLQAVTGDTRYGPPGFMTVWLSVLPSSIWRSLQVWRFVTYQFLHGNLFHILFNMLGLYFLGPTLERHWGGRRFLLFYLGCGIIGGLTYPVLLRLGILAAVHPLIGASGAILGMLAACAIMFPHFVVFLLFFPVPIRVAAIILMVMATADIIARGANAGGEAAHLGGMAAGAIYVLSESWRTKLRLKLRTGSWEKQIAESRTIQIEVDRILQKVHDHGIHSLTRREKSTLRRATELERMRNGL